MGMLAWFFKFHAARSPMFSLTSSPVPSRRGSRILLGFSLDAGGHMQYQNLPFGGTRKCLIPAEDHRNLSWVGFKSKLRLRPVMNDVTYFAFP
eukprot:5246041-Amphidinium_carterae.1